MATPADQRLLDLLEKWLNSLELHLKYAQLDDESYSKIQPWTQHQRPSRWIVDLAKQKALALQSQVRERVKSGDTKFSDSLELMHFLANLVGAEHIERFIPLAHADTERVGEAAVPEARAPSPPSASATGTREMPMFVTDKQRAPEPPGTSEVARAERKMAARQPAPAHDVSEPTHRKASARDMPPAAMHEQVIADAARLVQWGRKWYELAELISSMADRPSLIDVRRILKDNKSVIDKKAGRS